METAYPHIAVASDGTEYQARIYNETPGLMNSGPNLMILDSADRPESVTIGDFRWVRDHGYGEDRYYCSGYHPTKGWQYYYCK